MHPASIGRIILSIGRSARTGPWHIQRCVRFVPKEPEDIFDRVVVNEVSPRMLRHGFEST
jgi:hypothetical protein